MQMNISCEFNLKYAYDVQFNLSYADLKITIIGT